MQKGHFYSRVELSYLLSTSHLYTFLKGETMWKSWKVEYTSRVEQHVGDVSPPLLQLCFHSLLLAFFSATLRQKCL